MQQDKERTKPSLEPAAARSFLSRHAATLISLIAIIAYAAFIQSIWGWPVLVRSWTQIGPVRLGAAIALLFVSHFVRCYRIYDYFLDDLKGRFLSLFRVTQLHNIINILFPFRTGEASFPLLMRLQFGMSVARSSSSLIWMRVLDLHALLAVGGLGFVLLSSHPVSLGLVWLAYCILPVAGFLGQAPLHLVASKHLPARFQETIDEAFAGLPRSTRSFLRAWFMTVLNWGIKVATLAWILVLLGVPVWQSAIGGALGGELSSVLPFHAPAGVGTYPAGIAAGAALFGGPAAAGGFDSLGKASVNAHILILVSALLGTGLSLLLSPKPATGSRRD